MILRRGGMRVDHWCDRDQNSSASLCTEVDPCAWAFLLLIFGEISNDMECKTIRPIQERTGPFKTFQNSTIFASQCLLFVLTCWIQTNPTANTHLNLLNLTFQFVAPIICSSITITFWHTIQHSEYKFSCFIANLYILLPADHPELDPNPSWLVNSSHWSLLS